MAKFISGFVAGKVAGFSKSESSLIGASTIPQLSTTLAVVFAGFESGFIGQEFVTAMVVLSIVTTILGPLLVRFIKEKEFIFENETQQPR